MWQRSPFLPILVLHTLLRLVPKTTLFIFTVQCQYALNVFAALLDNLYICDACDAEGVPDLKRSSGRHTDHHHLIRYLAPEKRDNKALPTEQRLTSIEGRLGGTRTQLDDLSGSMGDLTARVGDLTEDLNARNGSIEQLLHMLVGATEGCAA